MLQYNCTNPWCLDSWHYTARCPYRGPAPISITPPSRAAVDHLRELERAGMELPTFGIIPRSWLWGVPLALVIFVALIILI